MLNPYGVVYIFTYLHCIVVVVVTRVSKSSFYGLQHLLRKEEKATPSRLACVTYCQIELDCKRMKTLHMLQSSFPSTCRTSLIVSKK